jgi:hypothetical protein
MGGRCLTCGAEMTTGGCPHCGLGLSRSVVRRLDAQCVSIDELLKTERARVVKAAVDVVTQNLGAGVFDSPMSDTAETIIRDLEALKEGK